MIRISIIHPTIAVSSVMAQALSHEDDFRIIDQVSTTLEALSRIGNDNCHVVLASATLPNDGAITLIQKLKQRNSKVRVVVTGGANDEAQIMRAVVAGAAGYVLKTDGTSKLVDAVRAAYEGRAFVSQEIAAYLMTQVARLSSMTSQSIPNTTAYTSLTERENDVLQLLAKGYSNKAIAEQLVISVGTVKNHVHNVLKKLNLSNRKEVTSYLAHVSGGSAFTKSRLTAHVA